MEQPPPESPAPSWVLLLVLFLLGAGLLGVLGFVAFLLTVGDEAEILPFIYYLF